MCVHVNKDHTLFCQLEVPPVTQSYRLHDDKQKSGQNTEEMPGANTPKVHTFFFYFHCLNYERAAE